MQIPTKNTRRSFCKAVTVGSLAAVSSLAGCLGEDDDGGEPGEATDNPEDETSFTVGGSNSGDTTFRTMQGLLNLLGDTDIDLTIQETGGASANLRFYDEGQIDFGGASTLDIASAHDSIYAFENEPVDIVPHQAFRYGILHCAMYAREETDIYHWDDLEGRDVWPMSPGSSVRFGSEIVLQELGLWDNVEIFNVPHNDVANALEEERIEAIAIDLLGYRALGGGYAEEVDARVPLRALEMDEERQQQIEEIPGIPFEMVDAYGWEQDVGLDEIPTWGIDLQAFFGSHMSEDVCHEITSRVIEDPDTMIASQNGFPEDAEQMAEAIDPDYPVHPGAIAAFEESDIDTSDWMAGEID